MNQQLTAQVGADGVLRLTVDLGAEAANRDVRVAVQVLPTPMTPEEWAAFLRDLSDRYKDDPTFMAALDNDCDPYQGPP